MHKNRILLPRIMNKTIGLYLAVIMLLAASIISLGGLSIKQIEAFHSNWRDWNNNNFLERWYETKGDPAVQAIIIAWGLKLNSLTNKCYNDVYLNIGGSFNCNREMLGVVRFCEEHHNMFWECKDNRLWEYLDYNGLLK